MALTTKTAFVSIVDPAYYEARAKGAEPFKVVDALTEFGCRLANFDRRTAAREDPDLYLQWRASLDRDSERRDDDSLIVSASSYCYRFKLLAERMIKAGFPRDFIQQRGSVAKLREREKDSAVQKLSGLPIDPLDEILTAIRSLHSKLDEVIKLASYEKRSS